MTLDSIRDDLLSGWRQLLRQPGSTAVAAVTLALGIGATTAIFGIVNAVILRPLPFRAPEELVRIRSSRVDGIGESASYPDFADWRTRNHVFAAMAAFHTDRFTLTGHGEPLHVPGAVVSAQLFSLIGVEPALGRTFLADEDQLPAEGRGLGIVLSHRLWTGHFGSDPGVLGQTLYVDNRPFSIVGVMPSQFQFPVQSTPADFWIPIAVDFMTPPGPPAAADQRSAHYLAVIARLRPRTSVAQAQREMADLVAGLNREHPDIAPRSAQIAPELDTVTRPVRPIMLIVLAAVGCVLLIGCANASNLLLARGAARQHEMAIRAALGASRARIIRQLLAESLMLALLAGAGGLLLVFEGFPLLKAVIPAAVPRLADAHVDLTMLLFSLAASLLTAVVFGLAPALQLSRVEIVAPLKDAMRGASAGRHHTRLRNSLVILDVAIAAMLLVSAGLLVQSLWRLQRADPGFRPDDVLTFKIDLPPVRYPGAPAQPRFFEALLERLRNVPGVRAASAVMPLPLDGNVGSSVDVEGRPMSAAERPLARYAWIEPDYFRALGIRLLQGRDVSVRDALGSTPVAIVNETFANRIFPDGRAVGSRIAPGIFNGYPAPPMREIVGIVADVKTQGQMSLVEPQVYVPLAQSPLGSMTIVVQTAGDPSSLVPSVRREVAALDSSLPIYGDKLLSDYLSDSIAPSRFSGLLLGMFAALAVALAAIGLYGVISYAAARRTREIGLRIALGAQKREVLGLIVGNAIRLTGIGVVLGLAAALGVTRLLSRLLYGIGPNDPLTFVAASTLLLLVALLASYVPARRAARVDPIVALRTE